VADPEKMKGGYGLHYYYIIIQTNCSNLMHF